MGIGTLLGYLIGMRSSILTLAAHPRTWLIGLVLVLSAGLAREYDGEDLLHEPWYILIPLGASLIASFTLFCVFYLPIRIAGASAPAFFAAYRTFLGLFWMTAPLAWLYAVPYERLFDPVSAARANVCTLAAVSIWRVALMVRVGVVLFGMSPKTAFFRVMAYSDTVALIALSFLPFSIIDIMGGVRVSEADAAVRSSAQFVGCWGGCSLIFWWLAALTATNRSCWALPWQKDAIAADARTVSPVSSLVAPVSWPVRILGLLSLAVWIPILPLTQEEQRLRWRVESAFREDRIHDAIAEMSAHVRADFPPQWEPPPRFLKGESPTKVFDIWDEILHNDPDPWVRQYYLERFKGLFERGNLNRYDEKVANLLNRMPEGSALLRKWAADPQINWHLEQLDSHLRPELRKEILKAK